MDGWWNEEEKFYALDDSPEEEEMMPDDDAGRITNPFTPISVADHFEQLANKPQPQPKAYMPPKPGQLYGQSFPSRAPLTPARPLSSIQQGDLYGYDGSANTPGTPSVPFPPAAQAAPLGYGVGASPLGAATIDDTASFSTRTNPAQHSEPSSAPAAGMPPYAVDMDPVTFPPVGSASPYPGFPPLPHANFSTQQQPAAPAPESVETPAPALDWSLPAYPKANPEWQPDEAAQPGVPDFIKELKEEEEKNAPMDRLQIPAYLRVQPLPRKAPRPAPAAQDRPAEKPQETPAQAPVSESTPVVLPMRGERTAAPAPQETNDTAPSAKEEWFSDDVYKRPSGQPEAAPEAPQAELEEAIEQHETDAVQTASPAAESVPQLQVPAVEVSKADASEAAPAANAAEPAIADSEQPRRRRRRSEHSKPAPEAPQTEAASEPAAPSQEDARPFVPAVGAEDSPVDPFAARPVSTASTPYNQPFLQADEPRSDEPLRPAFSELKAPPFPTRQSATPLYTGTEIDGEDDWRPDLPPVNTPAWLTLDGTSTGMPTSLPPLSNNGDGAFFPPMNDEPSPWPIFSGESEEETPGASLLAPPQPFAPPATDIPSQWQPYSGSTSIPSAGAFYPPVTDEPAPWSLFPAEDEEEAPEAGLFAPPQPFAPPATDIPPQWQPYSGSTSIPSAGTFYPPVSDEPDPWSPFSDENEEEESNSAPPLAADPPAPWLVLGDEDLLEQKPAKAPAAPDTDDLFADLPPLPEQPKPDSAPKPDDDPLFGTSSYDAGDMPNPSRGNLPYEVVSEYDTLNRLKESAPAPEETVTDALVSAADQPKPGEPYGHAPIFAEKQPEQPPPPLVPPKKTTSDKPRINPVRLVLLLAAIIMALFCVIAGTKMLLAYVQNTEAWGQTNEEFFKKYGIDINKAGETVELPADGSTFPPTSPPAQVVAQQTAAQPIDILATDGSAQAPTPTPVRRTRLTQYPLNPLQIKLGSMEQITSEYPDVVGRLFIPGVLDEWIVQRNNTYYLNHNYRGTSAEGGAVFMDISCTLDTPPENLHLRGSGSVPGKTFHPLWQYKTGGMDFVNTAEMVQVTTLYEENHYLLYAVIEASSDPNNPNYFNYSSYPTFSTDEEMMEYLALAKQHSIYTLPTDVQPGDRLLTLSTSDEGNNLVLIFRMAR